MLSYSEVTTKEMPMNEQRILLILEAINYMDENPLICESVSDEQLAENIVGKMLDKVNGVLAKGGLKIAKSRGLMDIAYDLCKGAGRIFLHLIKGDTEAVKEELKKVTKEHVVDFLMRMDAFTFKFLFATPILMLNRITGWHIEPAAISKSFLQKAEDVKNAIKNVAVHINDYFHPKHAKKSLKLVKALEKQIADPMATVKA